MAKTKRARSRSDGWANVFTALGDATRDKRMGARFGVTRVTELEAEELYRGDDMAARVIELPPNMALRNGFTVGISSLEAEGDALPTPKVEQTDAAPGPTESDAHETEEAIAAWLDELNTIPTLIEARCWERAYGGCAMLMGIDDGQAFDKPVREGTIRGVRYLVNLRPRECWPIAWNTNPRSRGFGQPVLYQVRRETSGNVAQTAGFVVHSSRIIRFDGVRVSRRHTQENRGWGDSILNRLVGVLRDFQSSFETVPILLTDFAQAVWKMKGLAEMLAGDEAELVAERIRQADVARSMLRALVTDAEDDFSRQQTPVAGLPELLDRQSKRFAAAANIPPSLLYGEAPAGLNATGEVNARWFYDELEAQRRVVLRPRLNKLVRYGFLSSEGPTGGVEPARWSIKFGPIWIPLPAEVADLRLKVAQADQIYLGAQVLTPEEVAASRFGGDEWSMETRLDMETRALQAAADPSVDPNQPPPDPAEDPNEPDPNDPGTTDPKDPAEPKEPPEG